MPDTTFECYWCAGTAVDEEGRICLACNGTTSLTWERISFLGGADRYPLVDRILAAATDRSGLPT